MCGSAVCAFRISTASPGIPMPTRRSTRWSTPSWARLPTAISARIFRRPIRNGAAHPRTTSSPSRSSGCGGAAAASPISTSPSCARRRGSGRIATPCARASPAIAGVDIDRVAVKATTNENARFHRPPRRHRGDRHRDRPAAVAGAAGAAVIDDEIARAAARVLDLCRAKGLRLATAESCTGGLVAAALTEIAGSSDVVESRLCHVFERRQAGDARGAAQPSWNATAPSAGKPREAMAHGRARQIAGRCRGRHHGHCRPRRRQRRQAGGPRAFCRRGARRRGASIAKARYGDIGRARRCGSWRSPRRSP